MHKYREYIEPTTFVGNKPTLELQVKAKRIISTTVLCAEGVGHDTSTCIICVMIKRHTHAYILIKYTIFWLERRGRGRTNYMYIVYMYTFQTKVRLLG